MDPEILRAVTVFCSSPDLSDEQIYQALSKEGMERRLAARLVEFLPSAYCRAMLEHTGARFTDTFQRRLKDGKLLSEMPLTSEPVWLAALGFARQDIQQRTLDDKLRLAGRSAEFRAANELLHRGSKLEDVAFTPLVLTWPEEGPEAEHS